MKHNLPAPSQAWGSDIDRRLANLESLVRVHDNKLTNSSDTLSALVQSNAANGVAQPFNFTDTRSKLVFTDDTSHVGNSVYTAQLDWGNAGSFMLVAVSGFISIRVKDNITPSSALFQAHVIVNGARIGGTTVFVPTYNKTLSAPLSLTTLINYNEVSNPYVTINVSGYNPDQYLVSASDQSGLQVSVSGVRY
jgi:hypothetical protein|nr:MAG TPA: hypothetical protein [Caudoviricetes sp.]DAQ81342.1 MAG TPA: hypothetical protein [Caudoviricetes sp.]